ncbi:MAG TPA: cyclopropane-fatty-acyl-phospholipid synthase family protein [Streptosporangiaceae bacterium]|nr:cyclopropane-fatty-acyl-phospholipid synthase family protein [Streptosporangiaceae bacterium]
MTRTPARRPALAPRLTPGAGGVAGLLAGLVTQFGLDGLPVRVRAWDGSEAGPATGPVLVLRSPLALRRLIWHPGELGLAQAYVTGALDVDGDLDEGLRQVWRAAAGSSPSPVPGGGPARLPAAAWAALRTAYQLHALGAPLPAPASQLKVSGRRHSRARDQAVIAGHYDLPSEFYRLILDPRMAYSSGWWAPGDAAVTLADAQVAKLERVCAKLGLAPGTRLLDIGCGWGSLTLYAAQQHQVHVTAVTLSAQQGAYLTRRVRDLGLTALVDVQIRDYRDITGHGYDGVVSIEMGEHVGAGQYPRFCAALHDHVRPGGAVLIQQMSRSGRAPGGGPFIESFIAPDMHMRPVGETVSLLEQAGLEVRSVEAMREHYVRTIRAWQQNFAARRPQVAEWLTSEQIRVWRLYLAGGALAFEQGRMGVDQILATRPQP